MIGVLILAGGVILCAKKVTVLQVRNLDHPLTHRIRTDPSGAFSIFYINSIYDEPVSEEFHIKEDTIILKGVKTKSPGVMGYYGFDDTSELHAMNKNLGSFFIFKNGMLEGQGLLVGEKKILLNEIGEKGDRIKLSAESMRLSRYLLLMLCYN